MEDIIIVLLFTGVCVCIAANMSGVGHTPRKPFRAGDCMQLRVCVARAVLARVRPHTSLSRDHCACASVCVLASTK